MNEYNIIYCFDSRFWKLATVSILSLLDSKKEHTTYNIFCMVSPGTRGYKEINSLIKKYRCNLIWREIKTSENPFDSFDYSMWSPVIFYRLFAGRIFPNISKAIYLDSDTLIMDDLSHLFNLDMGDSVIAGVMDMAPVEIDKSVTGKYVREFKKKYLKNNLYINSGVLLLDMKKLTEHEEALLNSSIPLKYPDQDMINYVFDGKIKKLPLKYNFGPGVNISIMFDCKEATEANNNPVVIHCYTVKPYIYHIMTRQLVYPIFFNLASKLGWLPEDFIKDDSKYIKRSNKTNIYGLRVSNNKIKLFGITLATL